MVRVVPRVPDCDAPEKIAVCPQDVVRPGPHLPSFSEHPPTGEDTIWISETTLRLINERVSAHRDQQYGQAFTRRLGKEVKKSLTEDRRRRADEAGAEVEALVKAGPPLI